MSATVIQIERRVGRGRQPADVEALRDLRDDLTALVTEGRERQLRLLALVRQAERHLARGWSAAEALDAMERDLLRWGNQMAAASAHAEPLCPDGETVRHIGHGKAA